jgi:predicted HAD superfamily Cof-like phosphohydrolase
MTHLKLIKPEPWIEEPDVTDIMKAQQEFHHKFEVPLNKTTQELYSTLIEEEHEEWVEDYFSASATEYQELKELADLLYVTAGLAYQMGYSIVKASKYTENGSYDFSITDLVSGVASGRKDRKILANIMYCLFGYAHAMGWDLREAYNRVHISNLSKLDDSGKPIRREDGKVLKGPNYKPPSLEDLTDGR